MRSGENGVRVGCGDVEGFHAAVLQAVADPVALHRQGQAARALSLELGWEGIVVMVEEEMRAVVSRSRAWPAPTAEIYATPL